MSVKSRTLLVLFFTCFAMHGPADEVGITLERLLLALGMDSTIINARKNYETTLVEQKYRYLQWLRPSMILKNDLVYPYKHGDFDDLAASNTSSLVFSTPLPTGTVVDITAGYGLTRAIVDPLIDLEGWGFTQDLQAKIGVGQSLDPWWLHTRQNPYNKGAGLKTIGARNEYNGSVKAVLLSFLQNYTALRKAERNRDILNEKIALYDDMLTAYGQMRDGGGISRREIQNLRKDKWEDEQALFSLDENISALQGEIYQITGIQVENIVSERLIETNDDIWVNIFMNLRKEDIQRIEENAIYSQKEGFFIERLIERQNNAPLIKFEFGTLIKLPVQKTGSLGDSWKQEHFDDNPLNNWSFTVNIDLSALVSPLNKKNDMMYQIAQKASDELLQSIYIAKEKHRYQNVAIIRRLEDHITRLEAIIQGEAANIRDDELMLGQGALTELEYRQSLFEYRSKYTLLANMNDDLWLHRLLESFY